MGLGASHVRMQARPDPRFRALSGTALISALMHEMRTPVTALTAGSELLLEDLDVLERDELVRIVQVIHRGATWLQGLVENVMCAAMLAEHGLTITPRPVALAELARDVMPVVEPLLRQHGQSVRMIEQRGLPDVHGDGRRLAQVVVNLMTNASKYSGPGTRIDVSVTRRADRVRLRVADRGVGLPTDDLDDLFAPFVRGNTATAETDGAGLGLAIVKSIVDLHGGDIGAARRRGGGSIFWFDVPIATPEVEAVSMRERFA